MVDLALLHTFSHKAEASQKVYRKLLKAMSEPGKIIDIAFVTEQYGVNNEGVELLLYPSVWAIAQSLLDSDCSVYVSPVLAQKTFTQSLSFYMDAELNNNKKIVDFAFITIDELDENLSEFNVGQLEAPHKSCTLIIQTPSISDKPQLGLSGPGIERVKHLWIEGLHADQIELIQANHRLYPCGVDFIFCTPEKIVALPRSTALSFNPEIEV